MITPYTNNFTYAYFLTRYECGMTNVLYQGEIGVWILAYRAISSVTISFLLDNTFERIKEECKLDGRSQRQNTIDNLLACCKLVTHDGSDKYSAPELMKECLVAVFLTRCLQSKGYFNEQKSVDRSSKFTDKEMKVAIWIHHLMRVAKFNSHEVTEFTVSSETIENIVSETAR